MESLLSAHPAVAEAAVIGVPDPRWGERPYALVVLRQGGNADPEDLRRLVREAAANGSISRYAVPERIDFVSELPRTSVGKLDKKRLRTQTD